MNRERTIRVLLVSYAARWQAGALPATQDFQNVTRGSNSIVTGLA
jgi:hypothetical protein